MKKKTLLGLSMALLAFLCTSCSKEEHFDVAPKQDMEFKGAGLEIVQEALQGEWRILDTSISEEDIDYPTTIILKNKSIRLTFVDKPKQSWYSTMWLEVETEPEGGKMHAFYPKYKEIESMTYTPFVPHYIKDGILTLSGVSESNPTVQKEYYCLNADGK